MLTKIINSTEKFFKQICNHPIEVIGMIPNNEGWELTVEILTDTEYTQKRVRNDLIAVFRVLVSAEGEVISYTREAIRERGKSVQKEEE